MATLNHGTPGLFGWAQIAPPVAPPPATKLTMFPHCTACQCEVTPFQGRGSRRTGDGGVIDGRCAHCAKMFGWSATIIGYELNGGMTNATPTDALAKIAELKRCGFALILRDLSLGARDGNTLNISTGDVFPCTPTNPEPDPTARPSKDWTWQLFTIQLNVGPYETQLFPHEFAPIAFSKVMECKRKGELREAFLDANDKSGHFTPSPELRADIVEMFGHLIGADRPLPDVSQTFVVDEGKRGREGA